MSDMAKDAARAKRAGARNKARRQAQKTATIKATLTTAAREALATLGFVAEERGGDAKHSVSGHKVGRVGVRRTATVVIVSRRDGAEMTPADLVAARAAL